MTHPSSPPAPMTAEICAAPFPNECCATEEHCIGRAANYPLTATELAALRASDRVLQSTIPADWQPTATNINALPEPLRKYIHALETDCDPAGTIRSEVLLREHTVPALTARVAELEGALRGFPHFENDAPITAEAVAKVAGEHVDMIMSWVPVQTKIAFVDDEGRQFEIVYEDGDSDAGIASGWCVPEGADWQPASRAALAAEAQLKEAREKALEEAARRVETIVVSGPEDDEIDHDDYRDVQIADAIRALKDTSHD